MTFRYKSLNIAIMNFEVVTSAFTVLNTTQFGGCVYDPVQLVKMPTKFLKCRMYECDVRNQNLVVLTLLLQYNSIYDSPICSC